MPLPVPALLLPCWACCCCCWRLRSSCAGVVRKARQKGQASCFSATASSHLEHSLLAQHLRLDCSTGSVAAAGCVGGMAARFRCKETVCCAMLHSSQLAASVGCLLLRSALQTGARLDKTRCALHPHPQDRHHRSALHPPMHHGTCSLTQKQGYVGVAKPQQETSPTAAQRTTPHRVCQAFSTASWPPSDVS